jgi:hypothetical protein
MGATHDILIARAASKYGSDWLTLKEVTLENFRFDLLAFNYKTKEIEITEVDVHHTSSPEKISFGKSVGSFRIINCKTKFKIRRNNGATTVLKKYSALDALSHIQRTTMLEVLQVRGSQRYSDLITLMGLDSSRDAGMFAYHLKILVGSDLVSNKNNLYDISIKGKKALELLIEIDRKSQIEISEIL